MPESLVGRLLVASPKLLDPNFFRSVIFVCAHDSTAAMGVILNRPLPGSEASLDDQLPDWRGRLTAPATAFIGGPVEPGTAIGLARVYGGHDADPWRAVLPDVGMLNLRATPMDVPGEMQDVRVFIGYAGWGAGQLEREIADDAWFVIPAQPQDPFAQDPDRLYREVLRRQPGHLAMFAYFPPDTSQN